MDIVWFALAVVIGAVVGSFLNVVILRLPQEGASIAFPASHCPQCMHTLAWYENIPVISYLFLGGRCRTCRLPISKQYPLVEIAMATLAVLVLRQFGLSVELGYYVVFCAALLVIIFIDIHHQIIPDTISLPGILLGFFGSFFIQTITWQQSGLGILCGCGSLYLVAAYHASLTNREGMGGGDLKLLAMIGAFLGWQCLPYVLFASSVFGSIVGLIAMRRQKKGGQTRIPFGPFLALGALSYLFLEEHIHRLWQLYLSAAGL